MAYKAKKKVKKAKKPAIQKSRLLDSAIIRFTPEEALILDREYKKQHAERVKASQKKRRKNKK